MSDYQSIAARKQQHLDSLIPPEWRLNASQIPAGMLSVADSVTNPSYSESINVVDIPRTCGLLTPHELHITEDYDIRSLLKELHSKRLSAEEVTRAFCKVYPIPYRNITSLTLHLLSAPQLPNNSLAVSPSLSSPKPSLAPAASTPTFTPPTPPSAHSTASPSPSKTLSKSPASTQPTVSPPSPSTPPPRTPI